MTSKSERMNMMQCAKNTKIRDAVVVPLLRMRLTCVQHPACSCTVPDGLWSSTVNV
jgi:hypothetical protein